MNQKYIFIDIDGTLFDHSTESIPESALIALNKAHKKGHKIYLSTGRANTEIDYEYSALPISGMILSCGAQVIVDNKIIYLANYPRNELTQLMEYMLKNDIGFALDGYKKSYFSDEAFHIFSSFQISRERTLRNRFLSLSRTFRLRRGEQTGGSVHCDPQMIYRHRYLQYLRVL